MRNNNETKPQLDGKGTDIVQNNPSDQWQIKLKEHADLRDEQEYYKEVINEPGQDRRWIEKELNRIQNELNRLQEYLTPTLNKFTRARQESIRSVAREIFIKHGVDNVKITVTCRIDFEEIEVRYKLQIDNFPTNIDVVDSIVKCFDRLLTSREFLFEEIPASNSGTIYKIFLGDEIENLAYLEEMFGDK